MLVLDHSKVLIKPVNAVHVYFTPLTISKDMLYFYIELNLIESYICVNMPLVLSRLSWNPLYYLSLLTMSSIQLNGEKLLLRKRNNPSSLPVKLMLTFLMTYIHLAKSTDVHFMKHNHIFDRTLEYFLGMKHVNMVRWTTELCKNSSSSQNQLQIQSWHTINTSQDTYTFSLLILSKHLGVSTGPRSFRTDMLYHYNE